MSYESEKQRVNAEWQETQKRYQTMRDEDLGRIGTQAEGKRNTIQTQYDTDAGLAQSRRDEAEKTQNETTDQALHEAYVGKMLNARNINQILAAMGRSGGAAESTILGLQNNYQTNRAGLERERAEALAGFLRQFNDTMAGLDKTRTAGLQGVADWQADQERATIGNYNAMYETGLSNYNNELRQIWAAEEARKAAEAAAAAAARSSSSAAPAVSYSAPAEKGFDSGMLRSWAGMNDTQSNQQIYNELKRQGYSDEAIARAADFFAPTGE